MKVLGVKKTVSLSSNTDLNTCTDSTKIYTCTTKTIADTLVHCPVSAGFKMYVIAVNSEDTPNANRLVQIIIANNDSGVFMLRKLLNGDISSWYRFSGTAV